MGAGASAETHQSPLQPDAAASKKEQGNEHFRAEEWSASEVAYTEAIALVNEHAASAGASANAPTTVAILWSNRSAAHFKLGNPGEALADALVSISLHPSKKKNKMLVLMKQYKASRVVAHTRPLTMS